MDPRSTECNTASRDVFRVMCVVAGLFVCLWLAGALTWTPRAEQFFGISGSASEAAPTQSLLEPDLHTGTPLIYEIEQHDLEALEEFDDTETETDH